MTWHGLQIEHLGGALAINLLALAWFFWGRGQQLVAHGPSRDPAWNWLAGAALLGATQLIVWIVLAATQLADWPDWLPAALSAGTAASGLAAGVAAWRWAGGALSRSGGWSALAAGAVFAAILPRSGSAIGGAGWAAAALAFLLTNGSRLSRPARSAIGGALAIFALADFFSPDLTRLLLRLPSEQLPQWGSRELMTFSGMALAALIAGLVLWISDRPRRLRHIAVAVALTSVVLAWSWHDADGNAEARDREWAALARAARSLAPAVARLNLDDTAIASRPEFAALVAVLRPLEAADPSRGHYWLWSVRDDTVVQVADTTSLGGTAGMRITPPGYRLKQLPNLAIRAARGERFESALFFFNGEQCYGLHVPMRATDADAPVGWLEVAVPAKIYGPLLSDRRPTVIIGLLHLAGLGALVLAGRTWLAAARRLHDQAVEAAATARAKNEMAGLVSHELRTPLQVMLGHLELLSPAPLPLETQHALSIIDQQCRQLLGLVNDTLDLCALEAGQLPVRPARFSPAALAEATVRDFRPLAESRHLSLELCLAPSLPALVETDAARLRQILTNLVANAIKYTPTGEVRLTAGAETGTAGRLVFTVSDSGPGLPAAVLARLGEPFHPGPASGGTGLGLALVQRLCTHLGGEFSAVNLPDAGCIVSVHLPAARAVPDAPAFDAPAPTPAGSTALSGIRIVLAEDNTLVRDLIATYLRGLGAEVEAVADGSAALSACRANPPDAVLLDLAMPGVDGRTAARALRQSQPGANVPKLIVGFSAESLTEPEARAAGFDRFFVKPVSLTELAAVFTPATPAVAPSDQGSARLRLLFAREVPGQLAALKAAVGSANRAEVARLAHYLQSSAYALSDEPLRAACSTLRRWAESPSSDTPPDEALRNVETQILRVLKTVA